MDSDPNQHLGLLEGNDSIQFPAPTQDRTIRKASYEIKNNDYLISPADHSFHPHRFSFRSPSPFKANFALFDEDNSQQAQLQAQNSVPRSAKPIQNILSFD